MLDLDWGPISGQQYGEWPVQKVRSTSLVRVQAIGTNARKGQEAFVCNPDTIPGLHDFLKQLPRIADAESSEVLTAGGSSEGRVTDESFSHLPPEIWYRILPLLPTHDMNNLRASSRSLARLALDNSFWRTRFVRDLPWAPESAIDIHTNSADVDWKRTYQFFLQVSDLDNDECLLGLANRRRIFKICERIAEIYWRKNAEIKHQEDNIKHNLSGKLVCNHMPRVAQIKSEDASQNTPFSFVAITHWADVASYALEINFIWHTKNYLSSLSTSLTYGGGRRRTQQLPHGEVVMRETQQDTITVKEGQWISSVTLTISDCGGGDLGVVGLSINLVPQGSIKVGTTKGDQRLLCLSKGQCFAGFQGEVSKGAISRLGLVGGQPPKSLSLQSYMGHPAIDAKLRRYLWKHELPPLQLIANDIKLGYWIHLPSLDFSPMQALVFGTNQQQLDDMTGISGDNMLWGFEAHYSNHSTKIGSRHHAMKYFPISGNQGERIVGMSTLKSAMLTSICFKTNWGRQAIFGQPYVARQLSREPDQMPSKGRSFVGFHASWWYPSKGTDQMTSCDMLSGPTDDSASRQTSHGDWILDEDVRVWDGSKPPSEWVTSGPVYGNNPDNLELDVGGNYKTPTEYQIVSWLDFSKPCKKIEVWLTHPQITAKFRERKGPEETPQAMDVQFVSIVLRYVDGTTSVAGPETFDDMYHHPDGQEPLCDCSVYYEGRNGSKGKKLPFRLHYHGEEWEINNTRIVGLRIWSSIYVDGLQFVGEDGSESPVLGHCHGEANGVVRFQEGHAVRFHLQTNKYCELELTYYRSVSRHSWTRITAR